MNNIFLQNLHILFGKLQRYAIQTVVNLMWVDELKVVPYTSQDHKINK